MEGVLRVLCLVCSPDPALSPYAITTVVHIDGTPSYPSTLVIDAGNCLAACNKLGRLKEGTGRTMNLEDYSVELKDATGR